MPVESTTIIIGAKDNASRVLSGMGGAVAKLEGKIGNVGKAMKIAGVGGASFLRHLVGPEIADLADQALNAKESLHKFNRANVKGAKGMVAMKAGLVAATAVLGFKFGQALVGATGLQEKFNDELREYEIIRTDLEKVHARQASQKQFDLSLIKNPAEKSKQLKAYIETAKTELAGAESAASSAKRTFDGANNSWNSWTYNKQLALNKTLMEETTARVKEYKVEYQKLQEQFRRESASSGLARKEKREQQLAAITKSRSDAIVGVIRAQVKASETVGMSADQLAVYTMEQNGATDSTIRGTKAIIAKRLAAEKLVEAQEKQTQTQETSRGYLVDLKQQATLLGLSRVEAEKYRAIQSGVSEKSFAQGAGYRNQIKLIQKRNALEAKSKSIIEQNRTEYEKFSAQARDLARMQFSGMLSPEIVNRELEKMKAGILGKQENRYLKTNDIQGKQSRFLSGRDSGKTKNPSFDQQEKMNLKLERLIKEIGRTTAALESIDSKTGTEEVLS